MVQKMATILSGGLKTISTMNKRILFDSVIVIAVAVLYRLFPHIPNVAPITALALYSGVYLDKKVALILPLTIMLISDLFVGFHQTMLFVYGSFVITSVIGVWLKMHQSLRNIVGATVLSSVLFFIITNLGVWLEGQMYMRTMEGLITCYYMALPFFRNTFLGDLMYVGMFFGVHAVIKGYFIQKKVINA